MGGKAFVNICGNRIKVSNIKHFGISSENKYYANVYKVKMEKRGGVGFAGAMFLLVFNQSVPEPTYFITEKKLTNYKNEISEEEYTNIKRGVKMPIYLQVDSNEMDKSHSKFEFVEDLIDGTYIVKSISKSVYTEGKIEVEATPDDVFKVETRYLYITTYQNDNYTFTENECDIDEKLAELDSL